MKRSDIAVDRLRGLGRAVAGGLVLAVAVGLQIAASAQPPAGVTVTLVRWPFT